MKIENGKLTILFANASIQNRKSTEKIKTVNHHMPHTTRLVKGVWKEKRNTNTPKRVF